MKKDNVLHKCRQSITKQQQSETTIKLRSLAALDAGRLLQIPDEKVSPVLGTEHHRPTPLSPLTRATGVIPA